MKKYLILFAAAILLTVSLWAQDTIDGRNLQGKRYMINEDAWAVNPNTQIAPSLVDSGQMAMGFYTADSLEIFGIAAGVFDMQERMLPSNPRYVYDQSYAQAYQFLRLYLPDGDSLRWIAQKKIHLHTTPIAYYANYDTMAPPRNNRIVPMYELFFDSAITVIDTFAAGMTYINNAHPYYDANHTQYTYHHAPLGVGMLAFDTLTMIDEYYCIYYESSANWHHQNHVHQAYYYLWFPILVPDTTIGGGAEPDDSLAVQVTFVDRLVAVQPNPATERVKVLSSCGMTQITVYNAAGVKVHDQAATGLSTTLNVQGWPAGTYILHIQTPVGVSTKRLVVAR